MNKNIFYPIIFSIFFFFFQNFNVVATCGFSICYKIILQVLFTRFKYLQIMRKLLSNLLSIPLLLRTILPVVRELTQISNMQKVPFLVYLSVVKFEDIQMFCCSLQCSLVKPPPFVQSVVWRYNEFGDKLRDIENRKLCDHMKR
jgi:hypothetical protein